MIKILIVDDEILVRVGIKSFLPWEKYGFCICGEAVDGIQALEMCQTLHPDIIFTDIRMPGMDGITLIQEISGRYPDMMCIVLTCLDETQYIEQSMEAGACGFFAKISLEQNQILELLQRLKQNIPERRKRELETDRLKTIQNENQQLTNTQLLGILSSLNTQEERRNYVEALVYSDPALSYLKYDSLLAIEVERWNCISDHHTFEFHLKNYLDIIMPQAASFFSLFPCDMMYFISFCSIRECRRKSLSVILQHGLKTYFNISSKITVFDEHIPLWHLPDYYQMMYRKKRSVCEEAADILILKDIVEAVDTSDSEKAVRLLNELGLAPLSNEKFKYYIIELLFSYEKLFRQYGESIDGIFGNSYINGMIGKENREELFTQMCHLSAQLPDILQNLKERQYGAVISGVISYIDLHYRERITLDYAASLAGVNSSYFSRLFKRHAGCGFVEYLTYRRIEAAKVMLKEESAKLADISERSGFEDVSYFSKVFKKKTGVSPSEFRNQKKC